MIAIKTSKWCNENLNASPILWLHVKQEFKEVLESRSISELNDEISDFLYMFYCAIQSKMRFNLPMFGAMSTVDKINTRLIVWQEIFADNGLEFNKKYLINGSNYVRSEKVEKALVLAKLEQH